VILFFVVRLSGDTRIMGTYANRPLARLIGWTTILLMTLSGLAALAGLLL
jgi:Mn2+/Fe2+ NRAMP family transporter